MGESQGAYRGHDYRDLGCQVILFQRNYGFLKIFSQRGSGKGEEWRGGRVSDNLINSIKAEEREAEWILQRKA